MGFVEGCRSAREIAEHERRAGLRCALEDGERLVQREHRVADPRHEQEQRREDDLQCDAGGDDPPAHATPVLRDEPREGDEQREAGERMGDVHEWAASRVRKPRNTTAAISCAATPNATSSTSEWS